MDISHSEEGPAGEEPADEQDTAAGPPAGASAVDRPPGRPAAWPRAGWYAAGLAFVAGAILGWLLIGWWLWPVQWTECNLWDLRPAYQRRHVALVAAEYARTGNWAQASADLAGWPAGSLSTLLHAMEEEAPSTEAREQVVALRSALDLPVDEPPQASAPGRRAAARGLYAVFWSIALVVLALAAVPALITLYRLYRARRRKGRQEPGGPQGALTGEEETLESWLEAIAGPEDEAQRASPALEEPQSQEGKQDGKETPASGAHDQTLANVETLTAEPGSDGQDADGGSDLLSGIFAGLETSDAHIEALAKMTEEVDIDGLAWQSREMLDQLRRLGGASREEAG
jgi:hypothetical protein